MNLSVLKKTRKLPQPGDIFVMLPPDDLYLFGRVIRTDANAGGFEGSILIYIYRQRSRVKEEIPELHVADLLVPPMMTNRLPWTKGYFEFVQHRNLIPEDELNQHCFKDIRGWYFDADGNQLSTPIEPVGVWGLHSYQTIDDEISEVLGIAPAP